MRRSFVLAGIGSITVSRMRKVNKELTDKNVNTIFQLNASNSTPTTKGAKAPPSDPAVLTIEAAKGHFSFVASPIG